MCTEKFVAEELIWNMHLCIGHFPSIKYKYSDISIYQAGTNRCLVR